MRIWDLSPSRLCRVHLLGEHRELHAIWTILTTDKVGYRNHPETKRWVDHLAALYARHDALVLEMIRRGYHHKSPLDQTLATGNKHQTRFVDSIPVQIEMLTKKPCTCLLAQV